MVKVGLWVELIARAGRERDVAAFLIDALPAVQRETGTICWFDAHLAGAVAEALADRADDLFVQPPAIRKLDVLAAKLAGG
jgi:hypothetical protein